ncbi:MAG TPA: hypothetical protein PKD53_02405, partial [Chloroflexaceae bacterium]|nr:hypothetical protein [Chloroflexaceae bacterium]
MISSLYARLKLTVAPQTPLLLLGSALLVALVMAGDSFVLRRTPLHSDAPMFIGPFLARTAVILLSAGMFVRALVHTPDGARAARAAGMNLPWGAAREPTRALLASSRRWNVAPLGFKRAAVWATIAFTVATVALLIFSVDLYSYLALEDNPVEVLSALLMLVASGLMLAVAVTLRRASRKGRALFIGLALAGAGAFFLVGMEEISWFQRIIGFETPASFAANHQNEFNLHNFYSGKFELLYYLGTFLALVALPFLNNQTALLEAHPVTSFFAPARYLIFVGALASVYNYNLWNMAPHQFTSYATLLILLYILYTSARQGGVSPLLVALIAVFVVAQVLILIYGGRSDRLWDITGDRQLLLPPGYAVYA